MLTSVLDGSVRADVLRPARALYLRYLTGWLFVSHGPVVAAEVVHGRPGDDTPMTLKVGDRHAALK